jgi:AcrR family transcriptional regulator
MSTLSRKQREIQQREQTILDLSRKMLLEQGYAGLTMDELAVASEYSKGVIYQHFKSKEDLVTALAVQSLEQRCSMFDQALTFVGRSRERMMAIGVAEELFVRLHPHHFHSEQIIKMASLRERASTERHNELVNNERQCFKKVLGIVQEGISKKDLVLPKGCEPAEVVLALWAINVGTYTLLHINREIFVENGITGPFLTVRRNCHAVLDGYDWKPLVAEWDYEATYRRILKDCFPEECLQAGLS